MKKKSTKTSLSALIAAMGICIFGLSSDQSEQLGHTAGLILAALGITFGGIFARDDDVTSEGNKAEK